MVPNGTHIVPGGPHMVQHGSHIFPYDPHMVPDGSHIVHGFLQKFRTNRATQKVGHLLNNAICDCYILQSSSRFQPLSTNSGREPLSTNSGRESLWTNSGREHQRKRSEAQQAGIKPLLLYTCVNMNFWFQFILFVSCSCISGAHFTSHFIL